MPIDATIPLGFKPPDQMQQLSGLLNTANAAQNLQQNQQKTQQGGIDLQERQGVQGVLADPSNYTGEDGTVDFNKALPAIMKVAPTTGMKYVQGLAEAQRAHTDAQQSLNNLTTDVRTQLGKGLYALKPDSPPDVVNGFFDASEKLYKGSKPYIDVLRNTYSHALQTGGQPKAADFFANAAQTTLPPETQQNINSGGVAFVQTDKGTQPYQTKVGANNPVGPIGNPIAPPNQVVTNAQGRVGTVNPATNSYQEPQSAAPDTPQVNLPQGETPETLKLVQGIRANANQAARTVPDQQFNSNQIIKLANETNTGKGAQIVQGLRGGYVGLPWTSDSATNFNQLGHYMALQTSQLSQSSGLGGTDAAHTIAAEQAGNKEWTGEAIKNTARVNRALSTGTALFNQGVENAVGASNNPFAARDFQNKWSKAANVDALRVYDAYKNRGDDPEGWKATIKEFGGPESAKFKETMQHVDAMRALVRGE